MTTFETLCKHQPNLKQEVETFIQTLPQYSALKKDDIKTWLNATSGLKTTNEVDLDASIKELWWHLKRLQGIGGSDIGSIICYRVGETPAFNNPQDIFEQKRMKQPPTNGNQYTRRGTKLESLISEEFIYNYGVKRNHNIINEIAKNSGKVKDYEFLVGNIDDAVITDDGEQYIIDYKAPTTPPTTNPFGYKAQLHHYLLILKKGQINEDETTKLADVYFDYANFDVVIHEEEIDYELLDQMKEYSQEFWDLVSDSSIEQLPDEWVTNTKVLETESPLTEEEKEQLTFNSEALLTIKALEDKIKQLKSKMSNNSEKIVSHQNGIRKEAKSFLSDMIVRPKLKLEDETLFKELLVKEGVNLSELQKTTSKYDKEKIGLLIENSQLPDDYFKEHEFDISKVIDFLTEKGFDLNTYISQTATIYPSSNKKAVKEKLSVIREVVDQEIEEIITKFSKESLDALDIKKSDEEMSQ